ncbi:hypothetical protein HKBW3S03_01692, partial [Candidatus Hakubella thermalkaliphila]
KSEIRHFSKEIYVFRQGDASLQTLFVLVSGSAEITVLDKQDREFSISKRQELEFFGEMVFFQKTATLFRSGRRQICSASLSPMPCLKQSLHVPRNLQMLLPVFWQNGCEPSIIH